MYLAGLRLGGRRVVVVGGGAVAERRLAALVASEAEVTLVAPHVTDRVAALAASGALRWSARPYAAGDLAGAWYVVAATDDPAVNAAVAAEAEADRVFCVRADRAAGGSAVTPATGAAGGVTVGVLGGGDPRRAARVRDGVLHFLHGEHVEADPRRPDAAPRRPGLP